METNGGVQVRRRVGASKAGLWWHLLAKQLTGRSIPIGQPRKLPVHSDDPGEFLNSISKCFQKF
jgi:hypothetical protein